MYKKLLLTLSLKKNLHFYLATSLLILLNGCKTSNSLEPNSRTEISLYEISNSFIFDNLYIETSDLNTLQDGSMVLRFQLTDNSFSDYSRFIKTNINKETLGYFNNYIVNDIFLLHTSHLGKDLILTSPFTAKHVKIKLLKKQFEQNISTPPFLTYAIIKSKVNLTPFGVKYIKRIPESKNHSPSLCIAFKANKLPLPFNHKVVNNKKVLFRVGQNLLETGIQETCQSNDEINIYSKNQQLLNEIYENLTHW